MSYFCSIRCKRRFRTTQVKSVVPTPNPCRKENAGPAPLSLHPLPHTLYFSHWLPTGLYLKPPTSQTKAWLFSVTDRGLNILAHVQLTSSVCLHLLWLPLPFIPSHIRTLCTGCSIFLEGAFPRYLLQVFRENSPSLWGCPWPAAQGFSPLSWVCTCPFLHSFPSLAHVSILHVLSYVVCILFSPKYKLQKVRVSICFISSVYSRDSDECFL